LDVARGAGNGQCFVDIDKLRSGKRKHFQPREQLALPKYTDDRDGSCESKSRVIGRDKADDVGGAVQHRKQIAVEVRWTKADRLLVGVTNDFDYIHIKLLDVLRNTTGGRVQKCFAEGRREFCASSLEIIASCLANDDRGPFVAATTTRTSDARRTRPKERHSEPGEEGDAI
jgi:hypothetical protein